MNRRSQTHPLAGLLGDILFVGLFFVVFSLVFGTLTMTWQKPKDYNASLEDPVYASHRYLYVAGGKIEAVFKPTSLYFKDKGPIQNLDNERLSPVADANYPGCFKFELAFNITENKGLLWHLADGRQVNVYSFVRNFKVLACQDRVSELESSIKSEERYGFAVEK